MKYQFYHDTETDEILSYSELKELHADLVRFQETEITDFNSYLHECVKNGCLLGAIRLEVHDIQSILQKIHFLSICKIKRFHSIWIHGKAYTQIKAYMLEVWKM